MERICETNGGVTRGRYDVGERRRAYVTIAEGFVRGKASPVTLLEAGLAVVSEREEQVGAFCYLDAASAREAAEASARRWRDGRPLSPLDGCLVAVKDTIDVAGMPSTMNSAAFDETPRPYDAACVLALREAGAVMLGKTCVPELALGTAPKARNPFDSERTAGGSSTGSGAAVGAAMVPVAIGNQTGGSLIRPASYNANYGFKPTHGALNTGGMNPIAPSQDHIGPMTGALADAWAVAWQIAARAGGHGGGPGLHGGTAPPAPRKPRALCRLKTAGFDELDAGSMRAFERAADALREAGVEVIEAEGDDDVATLEEGVARRERRVRADHHVRGPVAAVGLRRRTRRGSAQRDAPREARARARDDARGLPGRARPPRSDPPRRPAGCPAGRRVRDARFVGSCAAP